MTDEYRETCWSTSSSFTDVTAANWYNNAISTTANAGWVSGYPDGTFRPDAYITRAEFATIAARFLSDVYGGTSMFTDISGHWAEDYINRAAAAGWINGYADGTFRPNAYITRAEAVTLTTGCWTVPPTPTTVGGHGPLAGQPGDGVVLRRHPRGHQQPRLHPRRHRQLRGVDGAAGQPGTGRPWRRSGPRPTTPPAARSWGKSRKANTRSQGNRRPAHTRRPPSFSQYGQMVSTFSRLVLPDRPLVMPPVMTISSPGRASCAPWPPSWRCRTARRWRGPPRTSGASRPSSGPASARSARWWSAPGCPPGAGTGTHHPHRHPRQGAGHDGLGVDVDGDGAGGVEMASTCWWMGNSVCQKRLW